MHTELFVRHENVVIISVRIGKELKMVISILENFGHPAAMEEDKFRKDEKKS